MHKTPFIIDIQFFPPDDSSQIRDGWGKGMLILDGQPFWHGNTSDEPSPLEWTWVDLLEHLAEIWPALIVEQSYPFAWLEKAALHPGEVWTLAEERWARRGEDLARQEEPVLLDFYRRHNLAAAWKGMAVPALTCLRVGNTVWISPEGSIPIRTSFRQFHDALEAIGDLLSSTFVGSNNPRVARSVESWQERNNALRTSYVEFSTGLSSEEIKSLQGSSRPEDFWELKGDLAVVSDAANDSIILAAARMTRPLLSSPQLADVINRIRHVPKTRTARLDELSRSAATFLHHKQGSYAHESGYMLAQWLREHLGVRKYFDIDHTLSSLDVQVINANLFTETIDALAFWLSHGPCVFMNSARSYAEDNKRRRMILAHELCHMLIDRATALPVAEVLGGAIDQFVERRANAFAAELLLPRESVAWEWKQLKERRLSNLLLVLVTDYAISKSVACAQIYNSDVYDELQRPDKDLVLNRIRDLDGEYRAAQVHSEVV